MFVMIKKVRNLSDSLSTYILYIEDLGAEGRDGCLYNEAYLMIVINR